MLKTLVGYRGHPRLRLSLCFDIMHVLFPNRRSGRSPKASSRPAQGSSSAAGLRTRTRPSPHSLRLTDNPPCFVQFLGTGRSGLIASSGVFPVSRMATRQTMETLFVNLEIVIIKFSFWFRCRWYCFEISCVASLVFSPHRAKKCLMCLKCLFIVMAQSFGVVFPVIETANKKIPFWVSISILL